MIHVKKMHGCGNDFCLIPYDPYVMDYSALAQKICDRKLGIGADGLIVVKENPLEMIIYNKDGSRSPMSGNGIRCFAKYAYDLGLAKKNKLEIITGIGKIEAEVLGTNPFQCKIEMGKPLFNNSMLSVDDELNCFGRTIRIKDRYVTIHSLFMSDIHTVIFLDDFDSPILDYAEDISNYSLFRKKTNVDFVYIINKDNIKIKTYERGVGWTLASGSGAAASVVASQKLGYTKTIVNVLNDFGQLKIEITKKGLVYMTGPAVEVFECDFNEEV